MTKEDRIWVLVRLNTAERALLSAIGGTAPAEERDNAVMEQLLQTLEAIHRAQDLCDG